MSNCHAGHDLEHDVAKAQTRLKQAGLKSTRTRKALLEMMLREHGPFSIEELQQRLDHSCDIVTLYRNMTAFVEAGLVAPCDFGDGLTRYEWVSDHAHHHHIICQSCRSVEELELCVVQELEKLVASRGYSQVSHRLEFYGLCEKCSQEPKAS